MGCILGRKIVIEDGRIVRMSDDYFSINGMVLQGRFRVTQLHDPKITGWIEYAGSYAWVNRVSGADIMDGKPIQCARVLMDTDCDKFHKLLHATWSRQRIHDGPCVMRAWCNTGTTINVAHGNVENSVMKVGRTETNMNDRRDVHTLRGKCWLDFRMDEPVDARMFAGMNPPYWDCCNYYGSLSRFKRLEDNVNYDSDTGILSPENYAERLREREAGDRLIPAIRALRRERENMLRRGIVRNNARRGSAPSVPIPPPTVLRVPSDFDGASCAVCLENAATHGVVQPHGVIARSVCEVCSNNLKRRNMPCPMTRMRGQWVKVV